MTNEHRGHEAKAPLYSALIPENDGLIGFVVRGHTLGLIKDGWKVFIDQRRRPPTDRLIDELCVVRTADGKILMRVLKKARRPGTYDLVTATGPHMLDVPLVWAEKILLIVPGELSGEEVAILNDAERVGA